MGDANDRFYPDHVTIEGKDDYAGLDAKLASKIFPIHVRQIRMSKLHTGHSFAFFSSANTDGVIAIVTSEKEGNLRLCGFGSGGR